jgi:hypothetical protein
MDFIDLKTQQARIKDLLDARIQKVLAHGAYVMGPEIKELEKELAAYVGVRHAVGCASGTDALLMALMAYHVGPGDAVFTTPFTFVATAEVISLLGATPVFVDIDPKTTTWTRQLELPSGREGQRPLPLTLAPDASCLTPDASPLTPEPHPSPLTPKGVIPVDLLRPVRRLRRHRRIANATAFSSSKTPPSPSGPSVWAERPAHSAISPCTSFFPAKPLGCYGDGGMCFTDDDALALPWIPSGSTAKAPINTTTPHRHQRPSGHPSGRHPPGQFTLFPEELTFATRSRIATPHA